MSWLAAAFLACVSPAGAALSADAEQAVRQAAPKGENAERTTAAALEAVGRLAAAGLPERDAVRLVIGGLQAGRTPPELGSVAGSVAAAIEAGLPPAAAARLGGDSVRRGAVGRELDRLLSLGRESLALGATAREVQHVAETALQRGGAPAAERALESFKTLIAEGVDERDARRAVIRILAESGGSRTAISGQARVEVERRLEEKRLERARLKDEEERQREEEKRDERRAADAGGTSGGSSGDQSDCPDGDDDPSDPDCD